MPPPLYFCPIFSTPLSFGHSPCILLCKNTPPCCGTRQGEDCATKDFLSLPKKVLVTLIRFICSFFSTARRTNQEAPSRLSGFWVRRLGLRRGLRNSLRSDSPRPFSSVFLATSPPDKGGDFARAFAGLFNPFALRALPLYSFQEHRGRGGTSIISTEGLFKISPRRHAPQLSPIFCCVPPAMLRGTAGKKWSHAEFSFGFIPDIKKEVSQINGIPPRMI